jgi:hypothetical protein
MSDAEAAPLPAPSASTAPLTPLTPGELATLYGPDGGGLEHLIVPLPGPPAPPSVASIGEAPAKPFRGELVAAQVRLEDRNNATDPKAAAKNHEDARRATWSRRDAFTACYTQALGRKPQARGRVVLDVEADWEGKVTKITAAHSMLGDPAASACIERVVAQIRLPAKLVGKVYIALEFGPRSSP